MTHLQDLIRIGGVLHLGLLLAGALLPGTLRWRTELKKLEPLSRHIIWVHAAFIVQVIIAFGTLSLTQAATLASGSTLARSVCGFIAVFWLFRLFVQFFLFDPKPYLNKLGLKLGYHGMTVVFTYFVIVYGSAAILTTIPGAMP